MSLSYNQPYERVSYGRASGDTLSSTPDSRLFTKEMFSPRSSTEHKETDTDEIVGDGMESEESKEKENEKEKDEKREMSKKEGWIFGTILLSICLIFGYLIIFVAIPGGNEKRLREEAEHDANIRIPILLEEIVQELRELRLSGKGKEGL